MPRYEHLRMVRLPERLERRKKRGFGSGSNRPNPSAHSKTLGDQLTSAIATQTRRRRPTVTPSLILRVSLSTAVPESEWEQVGLAVLSTDADRTLVLFSSSDELTQFRAKLEAYGKPHDGQKHPAYNSLVSAIDSIGTVEPRDRIGPRLREAGFVEPSDFVGEPRLLDLELWEIGDRTLRETRLAQVQAIVLAEGGDVLDEYNGPSISASRIRVEGTLVQVLLSIEDVAVIDLPPEPDLTTATILKTELPDLPPLNLVGEDTPIIGIIDSGVNNHPLLEGVVVEAIAEPAHLGTADIWGHGTRVAGIAALGDLRAQLASGSLVRGARIVSAKVVNDQGQFDERTLVPKQMRTVISRLRKEFGCRLFVHSLGDSKCLFNGEKVGLWASTLDELARELDVLIIVTTGNRMPRSGDTAEQGVTEYPRYLAEASNTLCEPAGAMNVLTVGALAHGSGTDDTHAEDARVRAITAFEEPSPFTRVGPGIGGAIKPDVVDFGGTLVFDAVVARLRDGKDLTSAGIISLHHRFGDSLFASASGTSYAAPFVAFKASQLWRRFPTATANLMRALLVGSSEVPEVARDRLTAVGKDAVRSVCGHGLVDVERAAFSEDQRVVLYAEDELPYDYLAVYEVPVPPEYQSTKGRRSIRVTLAFDPPVRHRRKDYIGTKMSFRLVRGCSPDFIFSHYRKRAKEEGPIPELPKRFDRQLDIGPRQRDSGTVQTGTAVFQRDLSEYGDAYYVVVRCEAGWAASLTEQKQRFALTVELSHEAEIQLYARVRSRVRV